MIYFANFDPFHEGHVDIITRVVNEHHPSKIYLVPHNDVQSLQPLRSSMFDRTQMIKMRIKCLPDAINSLISIYQPHKVHTDIKGKHHICQQIQSYHYPDPVKIIMVLPAKITGDFYDPVDDYYTYQIGPSLLSTFEMVYVHKSNDEINSTTIRRAFNMETPVLKEWCHPDISAYINQRRLYVATFPMAEVIAIIGSYGSKSEIGQRLADQLNYRYYSTGDIYRRIYTARNVEHQILEKTKTTAPGLYKKTLSQFIITHLYHLMKDVDDGVIIEGFKSNDMLMFSHAIKPINKIVHLTMALPSAMNRPYKPQIEEIEYLRKKFATQYVNHDASNLTALQITSLVDNGGA